MTFLEKNTTKLKTIQETDYKNNPLDSKNIKRKYIVYNFTYIAIIIVFLLIVFLEFFQKI